MAEPTAEEAFEFAAKVIREACAKAFVGEPPSLDQAGREVLRMHLYQNGLELKENNDVFYEGKLVARIGGISYDGKTLNYKMQPLQPLHYIETTIELKRTED